MNMTDIHDMFHEYLDATNLQIFIEDMEFIPSEVLLKFPKAYDKLFDAWFDRQEITWVNTIDDDGYFKLMPSPDDYDI